MKKVFGTTVPLILFHLICCGGFLIFFTSSGYLLIIREEGRSKTLLIPTLILGGFLFFLYWYSGKCCREKGNETLGDSVFLIILYISLSLLFGIGFMIYVFIPWWIPNYKGGFLLP